MWCGLAEQEPETTKADSFKLTCCRAEDQNKNLSKVFINYEMGHKEEPNDQFILAVNLLWLNTQIINRIRAANSWWSFLGHFLSVCCRVELILKLTSSHHDTLLIIWLCRISVPRPDLNTFRSQWHVVPRGPGSSQNRPAVILGWWDFGGLNKWLVHIFKYWMDLCSWRLLTYILDIPVFLSFFFFFRYHY